MRGEVDKLPHQLDQRAREGVLEVQQFMLNNLGFIQCRGQQGIELNYLLCTVLMARKIAKPLSSAKTAS